MLDGILPKDFGKPETGSGMLANLLDKKNLYNGQKVANHQMLNGAGLKRPSSTEPNGDGNQVHPNKRPMLDCNGTMVRES